MGGGIAGLLAAHVSSACFDTVTILDSDRLPDRPGPRSGVPQGRHLHILMARGLRAFEALLPGLREQLSSAGAGILDFAADAEICLPTGWMPRFKSGIEVHACTRDLLEWTLRRRVTSNERIRVLPGRQVTGLLTDDAREVIGVQSIEGPLFADVIIDASGRASKTPEWLAAIGRSSVSETVVDAPIDYGSRWFAIPPEHQPDCALLAISPRYPGIRRGGTLQRVEGDRWNVLLLGLDGEEVPTDEAGFLEFARGLASPRIHQALAPSRPLSPVHRYRNNRNRLRHYERMPDWPRTMLALGDAVCARQPYAGLGMTACALGALALRDQLRQCVSAGDWSTLARDFQARLAVVNQSVWEIATNQHLRWPNDDSGPHPRPPLHIYLDGLMRLAVRDPKVATTVLEVMHMLAPPAALFTPRLQRRVASAITSRAEEITRAS